MAATSTSEPLQLTLAEVEASLCRDSFYDFVRTFWGVIIPEAPVWNWHIEYLCDELQLIAERVFQNKPKEYDLVLNISPGSSKSTIVSVMFPAWCWVKKPSTRLICASYAFALASDLARKSRDVIKSDKYQAYFHDVRIRDDHASVTDFANTKGGDRLSVGVNGAVMGRHGHFLIVDDPLDPNQAHSEAEIRSANHWMIETIPQRKISNLVTPMILIMQRLHHDDPTGAMLERARKEGAAKIKHICLPADVFDRNGGKFKVQPPELEKRYVKGVMDPTRFPESVLREKEVNLGAYGYAGQYGQNPTPASGGMFQCLVAGTMVETARGPVPIESVTTDDLVLTRMGYREVEWSGKTKDADELAVLLTSDGTLLAGTPDHRVLLKSGEYVSMNSLTLEDTLVPISEVRQCLREKSGLKSSRANTFACADAVKQFASSFDTKIEESRSMSTGTTLGVLKEKSYSSKESNTTEVRRANTSDREEPSTHYIELSGSTTTGVFPMAIISITKTRTNSTIQLKILSACPHQSTHGCMERSLNLKPEKGIYDTTSQTLVEKYIESELRDCGQSGSLSNTLAWIAEKACFLEHLESLENYAVRLATTNTVGSVSVYDLTIREAHEFLANGLMVHNCHYFNQRCKAAPFRAQRIFFVDRAATQGAGCYTAAVLMAKCPEGNYYVEHVLRGQWEPDERNKRLRAACLMFRNRYGPGNEPQIWVEREGGSSGRDAFKGVARALDGFYVREATVTGDKATRAEPWSAQLAALNVYLVEDGRWDVNAYVEEHLAFPLGKYVDQVDASTGSYNLLANSRIRSNVLRSVPLERKSKKNSVRILVSDEAHLEQFTIDKPALLVAFQDPEGGRSAGTALSVVEGRHNAAKVVDTLSLRFAPIDLADHQEVWGVPLPDYGLPVEDLVMDESAGKRLWGFLLKSRPEPCGIIVLVDSGDGRAQSTALALADAMRIDRSDIEAVETLETDPKIPHVYKMTKHTKHMVVR